MTDYTKESSCDKKITELNKKDDGTKYQKLFDYMNKEYDIILLESDMMNICNIAKEIIEEDE